MNLVQQINRLVAEYGLTPDAQFALAAAVLLDKNNEVVFDAHDVAGTLARLQVPLTRKETFLTADIVGPPEAAEGTQAELQLAPFPTGTLFLSTTVKHREAVAGGEELEGATAQLKYGAAPFGDALDVFAAPTALGHSFFGTPTSGSMGGPPTLYVDLLLLGAGAIRGDVTAGIIDVWTTYAVRLTDPLPPR